MTDELTIQPQVQRTSPMPYVLGGAAIGGVAGGVGAALYKTKGGAKTYEELIKEVKDKDKFELTSKKEAMSKAENELANATKPVYEGAEKTTLDNAIKARDAELAKLTESKTTPGSGSKIFKPKSWDDFALEGKDYPKENVRKGEAFHTKKVSNWEKEVKQEYERLVQDYNNAVRRYESNAGSKDTKELSKYKKEIEQYLKDTYSARKKTKPDDLDRVFSSAENLNNNLKRGPEYKRAEGVVNKIIPQVSSNHRDLTSEQLLAFADRLDDGATAPSGYTTRTAYEVVDGRRKSVKVAYNTDMFKAFREAENANIKSQREEMIESLLTKAKENITLKKEEADFPKAFAESITEDQAKRSGMYTKNKKGEILIDMKQIIAEGTDKKTGKIKPSFYNNDLELVKQQIERKGYNSKKFPKHLKGTYTGAADLQALEDMIIARKDALQMFNEEKNQLGKRIKACTTDHTVIQNLEEKIAAAHNADDKIREAKEALFKQFETLTDGGSGTTTKAGLTQAEAMEKESYKKLAAKVDEAQKAYDKVAAEKGKVNETLKKNAQETFDKAKAEFNKFIDDLGGKAKGLSGKAKAGIIAATAVVGGLIGASVANSKNKAAEKQIIA